MIYKTLGSLLEDMDKRSSSSPLRVLCSCRTSFVLDAVKYSFEKYCARNSFASYQQPFDRLLTIVCHHQGDFFQKRSGYIFRKEGSDAKTRLKEELVEALKNATTLDDFLILTQDLKDGEGMVGTNWDLLTISEERPWEIKKIVIEWCLRYVKKIGIVSIDAHALDGLVEANEMDFVSVLRELDKLSIYKLGAKKISQQDVVDVCALETKANFFHLLDALLAQSYDEAIEALQSLERDGIYSLQFLRFFQQQVRKGIESSFQGEAVKNKSRAMEKRGELMKKLGLIRLEDWLASAFDREVAIRSGQEDEDLGTTLETFCLSLLEQPQ